MLAVGYDAEQLYDVVASMPFHRLAYPELGALRERAARAAGGLTADRAAVARRSPPHRSRD
eukprot:1306011-Prymnesium_polylepis.1